MRASLPIPIVFDPIVEMHNLVEADDAIIAREHRSTEFVSGVPCGSSLSCRGCGGGGSGTNQRGCGRVAI